MKLIIATTALILALGFAPSASAEKIDCESMAELGSALDDIRTGLKNGEDVDDEMYEELGGVLDILRTVAEEEANNNLDKALDQLEASYEKNDRDGFVKSLARVDELFGALYTADCDG
jgi:hypothetical protein